MGDENERRPHLPVQLQEEGRDLLTRLPIEIPRGLVREEDRRLASEGPGKSDALLLSPRKLGRKVIHSILEPHPRQELSGPISSCRIRTPEQLERDQNVLQGGKRGEELKRLEDESHPAQPKLGALVLGKRSELSPFHHDPAGARTVESGQQSQQRGLATP